MADFERAHLETLLKQHQSNLYILEEAAAGYGPYEVPLHLQNEIEREKRSTVEIKERLASLELQPTAQTSKPPVEHSFVNGHGFFAWWASLSDGAKAAYIGLLSALLVACIGLAGTIGQPVVTEWAKASFAPSPTTVIALATSTPTETPPSTKSSPTLMPTASSVSVTPSATSLPTAAGTSTPLFLNSANTFNFVDPAALGSITTFLASEPDRPNVVKIMYNNPTEGGYCGWGIRFPSGFDASRKTTLTFWVRGETSQESFQVSIKDGNTPVGQEPKISRAASSIWTSISISLADFQKMRKQDLSRLENLSLAFKYELGQKSGTIYVSDFAFAP